MLDVGEYKTRCGLFAKVTKVRILHRNYILCGYIIYKNLPYLTAWHSDGTYPGGRTDYDIVKG